MKEAKRNFEISLAAKIKEDKKSFYAYVRSKSKSRVTIGSVKGGDEELIYDRHLITEEFNKFFSSVFTAEDTSTVPEPHVFCADSCIETVSIEVEDVRKRLGLLNEGKAPGSDGLYPRLLKLYRTS